MKYTDQHEWVEVEGDLATVGITPYAAEQLGDIVYVELPEPGKSVKQKDEVAVVESVKAASEVYAPLSGEVVEINASLGEAPETVNAEPAGAGWFLKIKIADASELENLMSEEAYQQFVEGLD